MDEGISLTNNGQAWVSVANPLRGDSVTAVAYLQDKHDGSQAASRSGAVAVTAGAAVGIVLFIVGLPLALAVLFGVVVMPLVWALMYRQLQARATAFDSAVATNLDSMGPRRIVRGEFLPGPVADAADQLVMGAVQILRSTSYRSGALGEPGAVYDDVLQATWALLDKLRVVERESRNRDRMREQADADTAGEVEMLDERSRTVWEQTLQPAISEHHQLVEAVAELDQVLDTPYARDHGKELAEADDFPRQASDNLEVMAERVAVARDRALALRDEGPDAGMDGI